MVLASKQEAGQQVAKPPALIGVRILYTIYKSCRKITYYNLDKSSSLQRLPKCEFRNFAQTLSFFNGMVKSLTFPVAIGGIWWRYFIKQIVMLPGIGLSCSILVWLIAWCLNFYGWLRIGEVITEL